MADDMVEGRAERLVATPQGPARVIIDVARVVGIPAGLPSDGGSIALVLGHGAGGGAATRDLEALAAGLPPVGISVIRVEQPWRVAGKRIASAPRILDEGWTAALADLRSAGDLLGPVVIGGRSAGARVACRTAQSIGADAVVALAFPLHPPGRPEKSRHDELAASGVPTLVVQGERDAFGRPDEFPGGGYELAVVPAADHGFAVPRSGPVSQDEALDVMVRAVVDFLERLCRPAIG